MKGAAAFAALVVVLAAGACGKVGDPKPPIIRTPEPVDDLRAFQSGYNVILTWTNPARYVDGNPATDLTVVHILRNGVVIGSAPVSGAGMPQSYEIEIAGNPDRDVTFAVQVETDQRRTSPAATVPVRLAEVPGPPTGLKAVFDQYQVMLSWLPPERNPDLVAAYVVQRADRPSLPPTQQTSLVDTDYESGQTYTYIVKAARNPDGTLPGSGASVTITATDTVPPTTPMGLEIQPMGSDVVLKWTVNPERDVKEYLIFRSDRAEPMRSSVNGFTDQNYSPGLSYQLAAVDYAGNQSPRSAPQAAP